MKGFNIPKAYEVTIDADWPTNADFYTPSQKKKHAKFMQLHEKSMNGLWAKVEEREQDKKDVVKSSNHSTLIFVVAVIVFILFFALK